MKALSFYSHAASDHKGRSITDIRSFNHEQLEQVHDYIQWLFPLDTPSRYNPTAPCLSGEEVARFQSIPQLRTELLISFVLMLDFFGFKPADAEAVTIERAQHFTLRKKVWLKAGNHNCLRISRILGSLSLLGLERQAQGFLSALQELPWYDRWRLGSDTYRRWRANVHRP